MGHEHTQIFYGGLILYIHTYILETYIYMLEMMVQNISPLKLSNEDGVEKWLSG